MRAAHGASGARVLNTFGVTRRVVGCSVGASDKAEQAHRTGKVFEFHLVSPLSSYWYFQNLIAGV